MMILKKNPDRKLKSMQYPYGINMPLGIPFVGFPILLIVIVFVNFFYQIEFTFAENTKFEVGLQVPFTDTDVQNIDISNCDKGVCKGKDKIHEYRYLPESKKYQEIVRGETGGDIITTYAKYLYTFLAETIGVVSTLILVIGGIQISIAGANQEGFTAGKEKIISAITGLMLLFLASLVLYTINPNFFILEP